MVHDRIADIHLGDGCPVGLEGPAGSGIDDEVGGETLDGCHGGDAGCLAPHKVGAVLLSEEDHRKPATVDLSLIEAEGIGGEESGDFFHLEFLDKRLGFSLHGYDVADVIHRGGEDIA